MSLENEVKELRLTIAALVEVLKSQAPIVTTLDTTLIDVADKVEETKTETKPEPTEETKEETKTETKSKSTAITLDDVKSTVKAFASTSPAARKKAKQIMATFEDESGEPVAKLSALLESDYANLHGLITKELDA